MHTISYKASGTICALISRNTLRKIPTTKHSTSLLLFPRRPLRSHSRAFSSATPASPSQRAQLVDEIAQRNRLNLPALTQVRTENKWHERHWEQVEIDGVKTNLKVDATKIEPGNEQKKEQVKEIETDAGYSFPADFLAFLSTYEGVEARFPSHYWINEDVSSSEPLEFVNLGDEIVTPADIVSQNSYITSEKMKQWADLPAIVIAQQCDISILLILEDFKEFKRGMVCLVDIQRPEEDVRKIANSFTEFLSNVFTDEEEEQYYATTQAKSSPSA